MTNPSLSEPDPLAPLADEFLARLHAGERPSVTEYAARHPDLAERIRELFPAMLEVEQIGSVSESPSALGVLAGRPSLLTLERLGDYHIVREVGRGGMGVVYEAVQESLGRHVALKVLPDNLRRRGNFLERFKREARTAGKLHHTNIVPVFGVGEHDGHAYYAMQYIPGQGLDAVLDEVRRLRGQPGPRRVEDASTIAHVEQVARSLVSGSFATGPLPDSAATPPPDTAVPPAGSATLSGLADQPEARYFRTAARLALQAAEALAYAHGQKVLHRDVKPSNLLLDLGGTVWITDFGLAKADDSDDLTGPGDIVGTLRYMAPERFRGQADARSDVYALGSTLYELLTLRPAYPEEDRLRLLRQMAEADPPPPRQLDARIPRDLETIVLKAMERDPARRYATAAALATDLQRFLNNLPPLARRTSLAEQTWRLCQRHPAVASLVGLVVVLLATLLLGSLVKNAELSQALGDAKNAEGKAHEESTKATERLREALVAKARALRWSGQLGQRFEALEAIREAAQIRPGTDLRTEAIAALCLPDLGQGPRWALGQEPSDLDPVFRRRLEEGTLRARLPAEAHPLTRPGLSPDGRFLAVSPEKLRAGGFPHRIQLWRLEGDTPRKVLETGNAYEFSPAFSPDSRYFAVGRHDQTLGIFETETGHEVRRLSTGTPPHLATFHPSLPQILVCGGAAAEIHDHEAGRLVRHLQHPAPVHGAAWRPDGRRLVCGCGDTRIYCWDVATGQQVTPPWAGARSGGFILTYNHAGTLVLTNEWSGVLRLWDADVGQLLVSWPGFYFGDLPAFSADDRWLGPFTGEKDAGLMGVAGGRERRALQHVSAQGRESVLTFARLHDSDLAVVATRSGLGVMDLRTGEELAFVSVPGGLPADVGVATDRAGRVWTWNHPHRRILRWPIRRTTGGADQIGPPETVFQPQSAGGVSISADGDRLAVPRYNHPTLVIHLGPERRTVQLGAQFDVRETAVSPDGRLVAISSWFDDSPRSKVTVWDADTGRLVASLPEVRAPGLRGFSGDGRWLLTYHHGRSGARHWKVGTWEEDPSSWPESYSTPDRRLLFQGDLDGTVRLRRLTTGEELARFPTPDPAPVGDGSLSPDGRQLLAWAKESGRWYVWDLYRLRARLAELGLDWDEPELSPPPPRPAAPRFTFDLGDLPKWQAEVTARASASAHFRQGRWADAVTAATAALKARADDPELLALRGQAYLRLERADAALADLEKSLARKPDQPHVCNAVSWLLATGPDRLRDPARSLELADRAVKLAPTVATYHNTLGVARYRNGQYDLARQALEYSLSKAEGATDGFDLLFLAMCHQRLGDAAKARDCYQRALTWRKGKSLTPDWAMELDGFQAEAERALGQTVVPMN